MERIAPVYGQEDQTLLILDSEQTLIDGVSPDDSEPTLLTSPVASAPQRSAAASIPDLSPAWGAPVMPARSGVNPLLVAAQEVIQFGVELSSLERDAPMRQLRQRAVQQVRTFEVRGQSLGVAKPVLLATRYLLCTYLDEMVAISPWGGVHEWTQESLLSQFHGETYGGQGFFAILQRACEEPQKNLDLLELIFVLLSLGFAGKYRVDPDGLRKLESLRDMIIGLVQRFRGESRPPLCDRDTALTPPSRQRKLPLGAVVLTVVVCVVTLQAVLFTLMEQQSREIATAIEAVGVGAAAAAKPKVDGELAALVGD